MIKVESIFGEGSWFLVWLFISWIVFVVEKVFFLEINILVIVKVFEKDWVVVFEKSVNEVLFNLLIIEDNVDVW